uniref:Mucin-7-like n=1 Tax=Elaeis guineensis var. tenera TaxID=51953 RepID=A0A6I9S2P4_ELAGV|nr:mucin-7-like [Elaeis guineensis]
MSTPSAATHADPSSCICTAAIVSTRCRWITHPSPVIVAAPTPSFMSPPSTATHTDLPNRALAIAHRRQWPPSPSSSSPSSVGEERESRVFSSFVSSLPPEASFPLPPPPPTIVVALEEEEAKAEEPSTPALIERESKEPPKPVEAEEKPLKPAEPKEPPKTAVVEEKACLPPPTEEKAVVVDEDGAKIVEMIEETVVLVAPPVIEKATPTAPVAEPENEASSEASTIMVAPKEVFIWGGRSDDIKVRDGECWQ